MTKGNWFKSVKAYHTYGRFLTTDFTVFRHSGFQEPYSFALKFHN